MAPKNPAVEDIAQFSQPAGLQSGCAAGNPGGLASDERLHCVDAVLSKPVTAAQIGKLVRDRKLQNHAKPNAPAPLAGVRVLLVDDMPTNLLIAGEMLESFGITVDTADNGVLALKKVIDEGNDYDIVLMDIQMPEMDGQGATRRLRAVERSQSLPIIAMTANAQDSERQRCLAAGMNDFLTKPIDPGLLQDTLFRWRPPARCNCPNKKTGDDSHDTRRWTAGSSWHKYSRRPQTNDEQAFAVRKGIARFPRPLH